MSEITAENLIGQVSSLPINEKWRLFSILMEQLRNESARTNGAQTKPASTTGAQIVEPIPEPLQEPDLHWLREHRHEYAGQWIALDGDRLIAHGSDSSAVYAAAKADGARQPLITRIPPADAAASRKEAPLKPVPAPDREPTRRWMREHRHEYAGQWVAIDGDRLIAHGLDGNAVHAAARADGAYLPLVTLIPAADEPPFIGV